MFDELRGMSDESSEMEGTEEMFYDLEAEAAPEVRIFGMTVGQRFIIAILLLATVAVLGMSCLLVFEKVWF
jgi:hypothetical protein